MRSVIALLGLIGLHLGIASADAACVSGSSRDALLFEAGIAVDADLSLEAEQCFQIAERADGSRAEVFLAWGQARMKLGASRDLVDEKLSRAFASSLNAQETAFYGAHYALFLLENPADLPTAKNMLTMRTTLAVTLFLAGEAHYRHGNAEAAATMLLQAEAQFQNEGESEKAAAMRAFAALTYANRLKPVTCDLDCFSAAWDRPWKLLEPLYIDGGNPVSFSDLIVGWLVKRHEDAAAADTVPAWVIALGDDALPEWATAAVKSRSRTQLSSELFPDHDALQPRVAPAEVSSNASDAARELAEGVVSTIKTAVSVSFNNFEAELRALSAGDLGPPTIEIPGWLHTASNAFGVGAITVRKTGADYLRLPVSISDDRGLAKIEVALVRKSDEEEILWEPNPPLRVAGSRQWRSLLNIPLRNASEVSVVRIKATDISMTMTEARLDVQHTRNRGKRVAYLFGIEHYEDPRFNFPGLKKHDIDPLADLLGSSESGFHVVSFMDEEVSFTSIISVRNKIKATHAGEDVIFYFSGHGKKSHDGVVGSCLLLYDGTCMFLEDLLPYLTDNTAAGVIVILDACYSGDLSVFKLPKDASGARTTIASAGWEEPAKFKHGRSILTMVIQEAMRVAKENDDISRDARLGADEIIRLVKTILADDHETLADLVKVVTSGPEPFLRYLPSEKAVQYHLEQAEDEAEESDKLWLARVRASIEPASNTDINPVLAQLAREILIDRARHDIKSEKDVIALLRGVKGYVDVEAQ